ncbi:P-loop containing nucleoside triphosphate hydrolase protein [Trichoderma citrinoviride]|uniref:P-loop containing nucleoside triphosphate hydrolase protein n=1 Tax=Trichoderma citrinoviride TaxID=58853 RepID=A0A2T4BCP6_9HYPO|nr:P-loop containing nucleoside triphosphate hydrolase protein [Trichoderma citrinoviride]PTB67011.1 P-loop containing nucleoside triphosphate hydrolase protein [Trichoderma citrinoviride]
MGFESDAQQITPGSNESSHSTEWDFTLPRLPFLKILTEDDFSPDSLASAIQHGATVHRLREYLSNYDSALLKQDISANVMGFPLIFYAVESNDENMVRLLIDYGASANAVHEASQVPLLAFAIMCGETLQLDTTNMVSVLLSKGASPYAIPMELFVPYLVEIEKRRDQKGKMPVEEPSEAVQAAWCSEATRERLVKNINLTQRYFLEKSTKLKRPSTRRRQVARIKNCEGLLGIPYFLVGQGVATELLTQRLLTHLLMPTKRPLVLCFAGPSGHGKTELARQLGHLLTLDLEVVDCTTFTHEMELFGPRRPYHGYEKGSAVNNFLVQHAGRKCIVFLDEFEKTTKEIHQTLLLPFDNGEYRDRRTGDRIDCSNTIWIMATNALDETILDFYEHNNAIAGEDVDERVRLVRKLSQQLREAFLQQFGARRISDFIPLLPFSGGEQAVITHKCLLELAHDLRQPINLTKGHERLIGDIQLQIRKDGTLCSILAKKHYNSRLGARSLQTGAETVKRIVLDAYLDDDEEINERQCLRGAVIDVDGNDIVGKILPPAKTNGKA